MSNPLIQRQQTTHPSLIEEEHELSRELLKPVEAVVNRRSIRRNIFKTYQERIKLFGQWVAIVIAGIVSLTVIISSLKLLFTAETESERKRAADTINTLLSLIPSVGAVTSQNVSASSNWNESHERSDDTAT
jgi:uncharacterized membrane protein